MSHKTYYPTWCNNLDDNHLFRSYNREVCADIKIAITHATVVKEQELQPILNFVSRFSNVYFAKLNHKHENELKLKGLNPYWCVLLHQLHRLITCILQHLMLFSLSYCHLASLLTLKIRNSGKLIQMTIKIHNNILTAKGLD